jgi:hypothetical protein
MTFIMSGAVIHHKSSLQKTVALSTCESELNALVEAVREALWLRQLFAEVFFSGEEQQVGPLNIFEDNQAALLIAKDHRFFERVKHVAIRYFFMREQVAAERVAISYCPTAEMIADMGTKPLGRVIFQRLRALMGLIAHGNSNHHLQQEPSPEAPGGELNNKN